MTRAEIEASLGFLPPFFAAALDAPPILESLWRHARIADLENPLPTRFKAKLAAYLAHLHADQHGLIVNLLTLHDLGTSGAELLRLLETPPPTRADADRHAAALNAVTTAPSPDADAAVFACAVHVALAGSDAEPHRAALRHALGPAMYAHLVHYLAYVRASHAWVEGHPGIARDTETRARARIDALVTETPALERHLRRPRGTASRDARLRVSHQGETRFALVADLLAAGNLNFDEKVRRLLELGCRELDLGLGIGLLARVEHDRYQITHVVAPEGAIEPGDTFELGQAYCRHTIAARGPLAYRRAGDEWESHPAYRAFRLEAYLGAPVTVHGEVWGSLNFSSPIPREDAFTEADLAFVRLLAEWIGAELGRRPERDAAREDPTPPERAEPRDALTGLAGRQSFLERLERRLGSAAPFTVAAVRLDARDAVADGDVVDVASRVVAALATNEFAARTGEFEFAAILEGRGRRIALEAALATAARRVASVGVAVPPLDGNAAAELLRAAAANATPAPAAVKPAGPRPASLEELFAVLHATFGSERRAVLALGVGANTLTRVRRDPGRPLPRPLLEGLAQHGIDASVIANGDPGARS